MIQRHHRILPTKKTKKILDYQQYLAHEAKTLRFDGPRKNGLAWWKFSIYIFFYLKIKQYLN